MADNVGDGVCLACTRRSFDNHSVGSLEAANDVHLRSVRWPWEVIVLQWVIFIILSPPCIDSVCRFADEAQRGWWDLRVGLAQLDDQLTNVWQEEVGDRKSVVEGKRVALGVNLG